MSSKPKVLIPYKLQWDVSDHIPEWEQLSQHVDFVRYRMTDAEAFEQFLPTSGIEGLWVTDELFSCLGGPTKFWDYYPSTLKVMVVPWVGCDFIDGRRLREEKGVILCNIGPNAGSSVADLAVHLVLSCFRMTTFWEHCFRFVASGNVNDTRKYLGSKESEWWDSQEAPCNRNAAVSRACFQFPAMADIANGVNLSQNFKVGGKLVDTPSGKTSLILGFGSIGQSIGKRLSLGFDMRVKYSKRSGPVSEKLLGYSAEFCPDLASPKTWHDVDVVVLSLPGSPHTDNLINEQVLDMCKDGVRIVNVGRGSCVDEDALLKALESGKVNSCGLDVFKNETTQVRQDLLMRFDVTALPHIGSTVASLMERQTVITLQNIESVLVNGGTGVFPVN
ncbi:related to Putative 2-hydroxyacid dehydrogenase YPL113C [Zygosaccharomyces bailii]|nr:related to Putative 2-hydroxyacid dehydrogenase YPL113C [Zygosaccharomyces bailii]